MRQKFQTIEALNEWRSQISDQQRKLLNDFFVAVRDDLQMHKKDKKLFVKKADERLSELKNKVEIKYDRDAGTQSMDLEMHFSENWYLRIHHSQINKYLYTADRFFKLIGNATSVAIHKIDNKALQDLPKVLTEQATKFGFASNILCVPLEEFIEGDPYKKVLAPKVQGIMKPYSQKLLQLHRHEMMTCVDFFVDRLDQDAVSAMRKSQSMGTVYYNWLLGAPKAHKPGEDTGKMLPPDPEKAKFRQDFANNNPQLAHFLALAITHNKKMDQDDKPNDAVFSFEDTYGYDADRLKRHIGRWIYDSHVEYKHAPKLSQSLSFWRNAKDDFKMVSQSYIDRLKERGFHQEWSVMFPLIRQSENENRMSKPTQFVPGGRL